MLTFNEKDHQYFVDSNPVPSVTQVINEWNKVKISGSWWYISSFTGAAIPADTFETAGKIGTAIHRMSEYHLNGELDLESLDPDLLDVLTQFENWFNETNPEIIMVEKPLYSPKFHFAGTPDIICRIGKRIAVVDIKTGMYDMAGPQLAAYAQLFKEEEKYRGRVDRYVLRLPKNGKKHKFVKMDNPHDIDFFLCRLYQWQYLNS